MEDNPVSSGENKEDNINGSNTSNNSVLLDIEQSGSGSGFSSSKKQYVLDQYRQSQPYLYQVPVMQTPVQVTNTPTNLNGGGQQNVAQQGSTIGNINMNPSGQENGNTVAPPSPVNAPSDKELSVMDIIMRENHIFRFVKMFTFLLDNLYQNK